MNLICQLITDDLADSFVAGQYNSQLLQSTAWKNFQNKIGRRCWRLGVLNNQELLASALIIEHNLGAGLTYLYCPRGPIIEPTLTCAEKDAVIKLLLGKVRQITIATTNKEEIFAKFEPTFISPAFAEVCRKGDDVQPANTLLVNLQQSDEQLLSHFHAKTRYNIKLAQKNNLSIVALESHQWPLIWPLFCQTSKRDRFRLHSQTYYQQMLLSLPNCQLLAITKEQKYLAVAIVANFGDTITYLHGASDHQQRALMAPYLLHWQIIQQAKKQGQRWYDLHGVAPIDNVHHSLNKVTRFKLGFSDNRLVYPGAYDLIYSEQLYSCYKIIKKFFRFWKKIW